MKEPPAKVRRTRRMVAAPKVPKATYGKQGTSSKSAQGRIPMAAPKGTSSSRRCAEGATCQGAQDAEDSGCAEADLVESAQGRIPMAAPKGTYGKQAWSLATDNIFSAVPLPAPKPTAARRRRITVEIEEDRVGD